MRPVPPRAHAAEQSPPRDALDRGHGGRNRLRAITGAHRAVVFVGSEIPDVDFWQGHSPPLIRLKEVATLINGKIEIDVTRCFDDTFTVEKGE